MVVGGPDVIWLQMIKFTAQHTNMQKYVKHKKTVTTRGETTHISPPQKEVPC